MHQGRPESVIFSLISCMINTLQFVGITFRWHNWPIGGIVKKIILDFFGYIDFSISWSSDTFLIVMNLLIGITIFGIIALAVFTRIASSLDIDAITSLTTFVKISIRTLLKIFYIPIINVFSGHFLCLLVDETKASTYPTISCKSGSRVPLMIVGSAFLLLVMIISGLNSYFPMHFLMKKSGLFSSKYGVYATLLVLCESLLVIVNVVLRQYGIPIAIIGTSLFGLESLYIMWFQPYYELYGNAIYCGFKSFLSVCYGMGLGSQLATVSHTWSYVLIWILFSVILIGIVILMSVLTFLRGKLKWAMRVGEGIPQTNKKKDINELQQQMQLQQSRLPSPPLSALSSSRPGTPLSRLKLINFDQQVPAVSQSPSNKFFNLIQQAVIVHQIENNVTYQSQLNEKPGKILKKYNSLADIQLSVRFLTIKSLRKRKECVNIGRYIINQGEKKHQEKAEYWIFSAIFNQSFEKDHENRQNDLVNASHCFPSAGQRWIIFCIQKDEELRMAEEANKNLHMSQQMKIQAQHAEKIGQASKEHLKQVWTLMIRETMFIERIADHLEAAIDWMWKADKEFIQLMEKYPSSTYVLTMCAQYMRNVRFDDQAYDSMMKRCNDLKVTLQGEKSKDIKKKQDVISDGISFDISEQGIFEIPSEVIIQNTEKQENYEKREQSPGQHKKEQGNDEYLDQMVQEGIDQQFASWGHYGGNKRKRNSKAARTDEINSSPKMHGLQSQRNVISQSSHISDFHSGNGIQSALYSKNDSTDQNAQKKILILFAPFLTVALLIVLGATIASFAMAQASISFSQSTTRSVIDISKVAIQIEFCYLYGQYAEIHMRDELSNPGSIIPSGINFPDKDRTGLMLMRSYDEASQSMDECYSWSKQNSQSLFWERRDILCVMSFVSDDDAKDISSKGYPKVSKIWMKYYNLIDFVSNTVNTAFDLQYLYSGGTLNPTRNSLQKSTRNLTNMRIPTLKSNEVIKYDGMLWSQLAYSYANIPVIGTEKIKRAALKYADISNDNDDYIFMGNLTLGLTSIFLMLLILIVQYTLSIRIVLKGRRDAFRILLSDIVALSVSIAAPPTLEMISAIPSSLNVIDEQATNPIWRDLSHTSSNNTILQKLISGLIPYVINVHRRVKEGGNRYDSQ
ncbi:MAG: hypothetical protein EZS28_021886, partial [Streblomastix strix]